MTNLLKISTRNRFSKTQCTRTVGIYRRVFPLISEAFIQEQAQQMRRYQPTIIANTLKRQIPFSTVSLSESDWLDLKQTLVLLTRSPHWFGHRDILSQLSLIHAHFGTDGVYAMALAEKLKIPLVVTFHGFDITLSRQAVWRTGKFLYYQLLFHEEKLQENASAFIAVSQFVRSKLLEKGYPPEKVVQHYIGVDTERFTPIPRKEKRYILCVGRHTQKKGIDTLLKAFAQIAAKHQEVILLQVGSGSMSRYLRSLAKSFGLEERVRFLGAQSHQTIRTLMQGAEVFALPSQTAKNGDSEALGIVFNEASACGVPVVSTWHGGIPEAVLDQETGFLVPEKDTTALADRLDLLLGDRALAEKLGQQGREFVCRKFDIRKQTSKLEAIYDSLT
ncbi:MAG: glycosyltransferase [Cyanophyceae cyanobacterium]